MNNPQFAQDRPQQHYGGPPTSQQNGQHTQSSDNLYRNTEEKLNDQFSQLELNNGSSVPTVHNNIFPGNEINNFLNGPQVNASQGYPPTSFIGEQTSPPKQFSTSGGAFSNQNAPSSNYFQKPINLSNNNVQSNMNDGFNSQESSEFINGTLDNLKETIMPAKPNDFNPNNPNLIQNQVGSGLQQTQSAFSVVSPQSRSQRVYPNNTELSHNNANFPSQTDSSILKPDFQSQSSSFPLQQSKMPPQEPSFPPQSSSGQQYTGFQSQSSSITQQSGFSPQTRTTLQQSSFPPQSNSLSQQPGFPSQPSSVTQQSGFPPQSSTKSQQPSFSPPSNSLSQQPGFPSQPNLTSQQPAFPPRPDSRSQQPGFPPKPSATQQPSFPLRHDSRSQQSSFLSNSSATPQQANFPPQPNSLVQQSGFPPQSNVTPQQPGFSPQSISLTQQSSLASQSSATVQQPGFPPQSGSGPQHSGFLSQPNSNTQQSGFPPQANSSSLKTGFPPQPSLTSQQSGFPPRPDSRSQQSSFPPKPSATQQQPSFPLQPNTAFQQPGFSPQSNSSMQPSSFPPQSTAPPQMIGFPQMPSSSTQQSGFPPQSNSTLSQPGFPPPPNSSLQQSGNPPQSNLTSQHPSLQSRPASTLQQPGFPPQSNSKPQQADYPSQLNSSLPKPGFPQQSGFPPQPNLISKQPGFPPQQSNLVHQNPGFLPPSNLTSQPGLLPKQPQQSGFPQPQSDFLPPSSNLQSQQSGFLQQQQSMPLQQANFSPHPSNLPPQQPGFPPQPGSLQSQQSGFPPPPGNFPPQPLQSGYSQQQNGFQQQLNHPPQQPGFPPQQPGYPAQHPGPIQSTPAYMGQPAPSRRLDPEQMPSPVQVIQDDQQTKGGLFLTNQRGLVPPLVTTDFTVQDGGNASPRLIRSTMYCVPTTTDIMKQTSVPFGLVISPLAKFKPDEYPPPIINTGEMGPVRCKRCKAYMSPYMQFIDGGKHFICLLCKASTEVPVEYFQHLDHTGQRLDRSERPELCYGSYEFIVPKEYCRKETQPKPPAYVFVIDVSYNNMKSGLVRLICAFMKELLTQLPTELGDAKSKIRVGFITYDTTVHFYNIKESLAVPQMMVVGDTSEMFMPLLDGFLCDPEKSSHVIDALMDQIPTQFNETRTTETILLPAIKAGMEALKNADCCGKLFVFHSSLPIAEAPGKLKNREDRKLLATDKEKTILNPQTNVYRELGEECVQVGCCVDLFITNNSFIDLATIGQISSITGGEIFKYTYFQADVDGQRFLSDLKHDISRPTVFDAVMRVRTSTGVRPTDFYGHFFMSNSTDVELSAIDCDKAIAIEVKHDDKLDEQDGVLVQTAMLYTSCSGQRRVRILNLSLRSSGLMGELYRSCDLDTIMNFFGKQVMCKILESSGRQVKESITNKTAQILATYRKHCASPSSAGQLILPECMKLMPLYVNCLIKSDAMSGGSDMTVDDRWFNMHLVITADIPTTLGYFYPRLIPIHIFEEADDMSLDNVLIPNQLRCSIEKISDNGAYILENGVYMFLWLGLGLSQKFLMDVFGVQNISHVDTERSAIPVMNNPVNKTVRQVLSIVQEQRSHTMRLSIIRQRDKLETVMKHFLVEDHGIDNTPSYVEFLCHMHKEIRNLLS